MLNKVTSYFLEGESNYNVNLKDENPSSFLLQDNSNVTLDLELSSKENKIYFNLGKDSNLNLRIIVKHEIENVELHANVSRGTNFNIFVADLFNNSITFKSVVDLDQENASSSFHLGVLSKNDEKKNYDISFKVDQEYENTRELVRKFIHAKYKEEPIKQKWNGIAQHVAAVVLDNTDVIVLTTFSTLSNVSIYSVYLLVIKGVKQLFMSMTNGVTSLIGELWAKQNLEELKKVFGWTEWIIHTGTTFVFGVTAILIVPFVEVYTYGVTDANYIQPLFGFLIVMANAGHCLRLPYNIMILAGGHYKQTQNNYIIAAILNIIISVFSVKRFGLVGVAIGTIIAMFYQTIWMALYNSRNFICWDFSNVIKQLIVDMITVIIMYLTASHLSVSSINYFSWIILAIKTCSLAAVIIIIIDLLFYRNKVILLFNKIRERF